MHFDMPSFGHVAVKYGVIDAHSLIKKSRIRKEEDILEGNFFIFAPRLIFPLGVRMFVNR